MRHSARRLLACAIGLAGVFLISSSVLADPTFTIGPATYFSGPAEVDGVFQVGSTFNIPISVTLSGGNQVSGAFLAIDYNSAALSLSYAPGTSMILPAPSPAVYAATSLSAGPSPGPGLQSTVAQIATNGVNNITTSAALVNLQFTVLAGTSNGIAAIYFDTADSYATDVNGSYYANTTYVNPSGGGVNVAPEPGSLWLMALILPALALYGRRVVLRKNIAPESA